MTLANRITFARVFAIPVFCLIIYWYSPEREWLRHAALGIYVAAAISDFLDGYIARNYDQRSELGVRLDPLADKLIINLGFVFIAANIHFDPPVPQWFPVLILIRDIIIVMGSYLINQYFGPVRIQPRLLGKVTTAVQLSAMIGILLGVGFAEWLLYATILVSACSLVDYTFIGVFQLKRKQSV
ncbi:MAG: CDP-alcohol phosphatidyltransferase family protein [Candidatus Hydrogenedentes bacterium]|nr:CDP-alcohol phosphatidyltransferase family protein [Candidatus Hydrogenedentota bacterium]